MFDTYSDMIFVAITWEESLGELWLLSLIFVVLNLSFRVLIPFYGMFRSIASNDKMDLISLISAFDYISVIDINKELMNVAVCNMVSVGWRALSEDIPQAIIQLVYYFNYSSDKTMVLISAVTSMALAFFGIGYSILVVCQVTNGTAKFRHFLRTFRQKPIDEEEDYFHDDQKPLAAPENFYN